MESNEFNQYFTSRGSKCVCVWVYTTHEHYTTRIYLCRYIHTVYVCFYSTGREKLGTLGACLDGIQVRCSSTIRSITDLCRGGGGGQTMCATNRRICAVVTHRQLLRPNEVLGRQCHDALDQRSLLVARFSRSVQVSSWFVAQQNLSTIAARAYHYIERVGGLC